MALETSGEFMGTLRRIADKSKTEAGSQVTVSLLWGIVKATGTGVADLDMDGDGVTDLSGVDKIQAVSVADKVRVLKVGSQYLILGKVV